MTPYSITPGNYNTNHIVKTPSLKMKGKPFSMFENYTPSTQDHSSIKFS